MDRRISTARTARYELEALRGAVSGHLERLDVAGELTPDTRVVLKPNLLMRRAPALGTTTHPLLVQAVALELRARGVRHITLADSPGGPYTRLLLEGIYRECGMAAAAEAAGFALNLDTGFSPRACEGEDAVCRQFHLLDPVAGADLVINLPKLKTHAMMVFSGAVKNLFGCVPGLEKPQLHFRYPEEARFAAMLCDLAGLVNPGLTIVDAVVGMEGDGPSAGTLVETGWTLAGRDVFALDVALCALIGLDPARAPTVAAAAARGLCEPDAGALDYRGDGMPEPLHYTLPRSKRLDFGGHVPRPLVRAAARLLAPRPTIARKACIGCGRCAESCPARVIKMGDNKAAIDYKGCIRCYCCHEMCPVRAIGIRRPLLLGR